MSLLKARLALSTDNVDVISEMFERCDDTKQLFDLLLRMSTHSYVISDRMYNVFVINDNKHRIAYHSETLSWILRRGCIESFNSLMVRSSRKTINCMCLYWLHTLCFVLPDVENEINRNSMIKTIVATARCEKLYTNLRNRFYVQNAYEYILQLDTPLNIQKILSSGSVDVVERTLVWVKNESGSILHTHSVFQINKCVLINLAQQKKSYRVFVSAAKHFTGDFTHKLVDKIIIHAIDNDNAPLLRLMVTMRELRIEMVEQAVVRRSSEVFKYMMRTKLCHDSSDRLFKLMHQHSFIYGYIIATEARLPLSMIMFKHLLFNGAFDCGVVNRYKIFSQLVKHSLDRDSILRASTCVRIVRLGDRFESMQSFANFKTGGDPSELFELLIGRRSISGLTWALKHFDPQVCNDLIDNVMYSIINGFRLDNRFVNLLLMIFADDRRLKLTYCRDYIAGQSLLHRNARSLSDIERAVEFSTRFGNYYRSWQIDTILAIGMSLASKDIPLLVQYTIFEQTTDWIPDIFVLTMHAVWEIMKLIKSTA